MAAAVLLAQYIFPDALQHEELTVNMFTASSVDTGFLSFFILT